MAGNTNFYYYLAFLLGNLRFLKWWWVNLDDSVVQQSALKYKHCDGFWRLTRYHRYTYFDKTSKILFLLAVELWYFTNLKIRHLNFPGWCKLFRLFGARLVIPNFVISTVHCLGENDTRSFAAFWYLKKVFWRDVAPKSQIFKIS